MKQYLLLILADLFLAGNFAISKIYQNRAGTSFRASFTFSAITGLLTAVIFWIYNGFQFAVTPFSAIIAILLSLLGTTYTLLGFRIMKKQGISLYTLFLMTGGMIVPYLFGIFFLHEPFSMFRTVGLLIIIAGVFASSFGKEKPDRISIVLCIVVFFLNGCVSVINKVHSILPALAVSPQEFVVLSGLISFAVALILRFTLRDPSEPPPTNEPSSSKHLITLLIIPALSALIGGISSVLQLTGAQTIDASLLYPFITGGSIVFSSLVGRLFFHETLSKRRILGILFAFVGTLFFLEF